MKIFKCLVFIIFLTGCSQYTLVKTEPINIKGISVTPGSSIWNKVPAIGLNDGTQTWTADGLLLNSITFFSAIKEGKTLFKVRKKEQYPLFAPDMLAPDIVEFFESSLAKRYDTTITATTGLKPMKIDGLNGFQFTIEFAGQLDIPRLAYVVGVIKNEKLYMIMYQATKLYYYDKYLTDVMSIINTVRLN